MSQIIEIIISLTLHDSNCGVVAIVNVTLYYENGLCVPNLYNHSIISEKNVHINEVLCLTSVYILINERELLQLPQTLITQYWILNCWIIVLS